MVICNDDARGDNVCNDSICECNTKPDGINDTSV